MREIPICSTTRTSRRVRERDLDVEIRGNEVTVVTYNALERATDAARLLSPFALTIICIYIGRRGERELQW